MTIEAIVARESNNPGYYRVIPTIGNAAVDAIDIHRIGFVPGEKVTVIQIGSQYGIAKKLAMLPSVLSVPDNAKMALATENPAQFFCAYLGAKAGKFKRYYEKGTVSQDGDGSLLVSTKRGSERLNVMNVAGIRASDFLIGDDVVIMKGDNVNSVAGWWSADDSEAETGGPTGKVIINFILKNKNGGSITSAPPNVAYVEYGRYVFDGDETGIPGTFEPFALRENTACQVVDGELVATFEAFAYIPNQFRLTYSHAGEWLVKTFDVPAIPINTTLDYAYLTFGVIFGTYELIEASTPEFSAEAYLTYDGVRIALTQPSILNGPFDLQWDYSGVQLEDVALSIRANGSWSVRGKVYSTSPKEIFNTTSGEFSCSAPASEKWVGQPSYFKSRATGRVRTSGNLVEYSWMRPLEYDLTTNIDCDSYPSIVFKLTSKAYQPSVTTAPPWTQSDLPESITVSGAGTAGVNGVYALYREFGVYVKDGSQYAAGYESGWIIADIENEILLYNNSGGSISDVPKSGWEALEGAEPAPTVEY